LVVVSQNLELATSGPEISTLPALMLIEGENKTRKENGKTTAIGNF
jgi:hypothetical protein